MWDALLVPIEKLKIEKIQANANKVLQKLAFDTFPCYKYKRKLFNINHSGNPKINII